MEAANKIAIITDTCCDLPQEYLKEYPIFCVPLVVTSGTESYRDNIDITVETIYARQKNENFKTSLPRPQDIEDVYSAIARQGYTHVIVLMIAECLSSANNLMRLGRRGTPGADRESVRQQKRQHRSGCTGGSGGALCGARCGV